MSGGHARAALPGAVPPQCHCRRGLPRPARIRPAAASASPPAPPLLTPEARGVLESFSCRSLSPSEFRFVVLIPSSYIPRSRVSGTAELSALCTRRDSPTALFETSCLHAAFSPLRMQRPGPVSADGVRGTRPRCPRAGGCRSRLNCVGSPCEGAWMRSQQPRSGSLGGTRWFVWSSWREPFFEIVQVITRGPSVSQATLSNKSKLSIITVPTAP